MSYTETSFLKLKFIVKMCVEGIHPHFKTVILINIILSSMFS
jgi:hypothetical protein